MERRRVRPSDGGALVRVCMLLALAACCGCSDSGTTLEKPGKDLFDDDSAGRGEVRWAVDLLDVGQPDGKMDGVGGEGGGVDLAPEFESCTGNEDCGSGFCVPGPDGKVCAVPCVEECPQGWLCQQVQSEPDLLFVCVWPHTRLCWPCDEDEVCNAPGGFGGNHCLAAGPEEGSFCGSRCEGQESCPPGYQCEEVEVDGVSVLQCRGKQECTCSEGAIAAGASTACSVANDLGTCAGERFCLAEGLSECDAPEAVPEACDGADNDCDGETDEPGATGCTPGYTDGDKDGFGGAEAGCTCGEAPGTTTVAGDCDDGNPAIYPGASEVCNGEDNDCDGETNEVGSFGCVNMFVDGDGDGFGAGEGMCVCPGTEGYAALGTDCDDGDGLQYPGAGESCNGEDDDCDGEADEANAAGCMPYYKDEDGDGSGLGNDSKCLCAPAVPYTATTPGDCNDLNPEMGNGLQESCDGQDNDCDGMVDEAEAVGCILHFLDLDLDGYGGNQAGCFCTSSADFVKVGGDCDDGKPAVHPDAAEQCNNGLDDNCNGVQDETDAVGCVQQFVDGDGDGYGAGNGSCQCPGLDGFAEEDGDCDDGNGAVSPGTSESCNGVDDDCDGTADEEGAVDCTDYFLDEDGDGLGNGAFSKCLCEPKGQYVALLPGDCDDQDGNTGAGSPETCDGKDNDCDGQVDEPGAEGCQSLFVDADQDGYGTAQTACVCPLTAGYSQVSGDCNDAVGGVNPGAAESCNGLDDNCDGKVDPVGATGCEAYYPDGDNDGYGSAAGGSQCRCAPGDGFVVTEAGDCNDANKLVNPAGSEVCNGLDDNCDGQTDPAGSDGCSSYYKDADNDGYGDKSAQPQCLCAPSGAYKVFNNDDCNDGNGSVKPGAPEACNGYDDNCDSLVDGENSQGCVVYYKDSDNDGLGDNNAAGKCLCNPSYPYKVTVKGDCNDNSGAIPSCGGKECGDDGCGGSCGTCGGSFWCDVNTCKPEVMVRNDGTCPSGYGQAGSWFTGPGFYDGQEEGRGYLQEFVDAGWMVLCTKNAGKYRVEVDGDDCGAAHPFLGCPAGFHKVGRFHVGRMQEGQPYCWMDSGNGTSNGVIKAGWMVFCAQNGVDSAKVYSHENDCPTNQGIGCPGGWTEAGIWHTAPALCDGQVEGAGVNQDIDNGWMGLCVND